LQATRFCQTCGNGVVPIAVVCPRCGSPLAPVPSGATFGAKSKTTAVLLAVFLSFWSWLYTFKRDQWKFLVGLVVALVGFVLLIVGGNERRNDVSFACQFNHQCAGILPSVLGVLVPLGIWIWAIIDVSVKSSQWYQRYSDG
jgi:hypothetical protein